jgi:hypothetical protein
VRDQLESTDELVVPPRGTSTPGGGWRRLQRLTDHGSNGRERRTLATVFSWEHAAMTRRRPSRRRLSGSYVMARLSEPVECRALRADDGIEDANRPRVKGSEVSIARCRELLGEEADLMTGRDIAEIRRHARAMAHIVVEMYDEHCKDSE